MVNAKAIAARIEAVEAGGRVVWPAALSLYAARAEHPSVLATVAGVSETGQ